MVVDLLIHDVPLETRRQYKAVCAERGVTMRFSIIEQMKDRVKAAEKARQKKR